MINQLQDTWIPPTPLYLSKSKEKNGMHGHEYDYYFTKSCIMENRIILAWKVKVNSHHFSCTHGHRNKESCQKNYLLCLKTKAFSIKFLLFFLSLLRAYITGKVESSRYQKFIISTQFSRINVRFPLSNNT